MDTAKDSFRQGRQGNTGGENQRQDGAKEEGGKTGAGNKSERTQREGETIKIKQSLLRRPKQKQTLCFKLSEPLRLHGHSTADVL